MHQTAPKTGFKFLEQVTQNYAEMVFNTLDYNLKQMDTLQESVNGVVEQMSGLWVKPFWPAAHPDDEVTALREQVQVLTQRVKELESERQAANKVV